MSETSTPRTLADAVAVWRATAASEFACFRPPGNKTDIDAFVAACDVLRDEAVKRERLDLQSRVVNFKEALLARCRDGTAVDLQLPYNLADDAVNQLETPARREPATIPSRISALGKRNYAIGTDNPLTVTDIEDNVLQAFLDSPSMDKSQLEKRSGVDNATKVLKRLTEKYNKRFAPAISLPGKKGAGGYRVSIVRTPAPSSTH